MLAMEKGCSTMKSKLDPDKVKHTYTTPAGLMIKLVKPKNLYVVGGRATSKSQDILADRSKDIIHEMPRGFVGLVADTYMNLRNNIIDKIMSGWELKQWREGIHYVVGTEPPKNFLKQRPIYRVMDYKHVISFWNGAVLAMKSLDRPSINAGNSYVHIIGDEAKFLKWAKLKKAIPTVRGDKNFFPSHYFGGQTFTTDMPNPHNNEDPWILDMQERMNKHQVQLILETAIVEQEILQELLEVTATHNERRIQAVQRKLERWQQRLLQVREGSTLFLTVSSFSNVHRVGIDYLIEQFETLGREEFMSAIMSFKPKLEKGQEFYPALSPANYLENVHDYTHLDLHGYERIDSRALRYIRPRVPIEAGFDAGKMLSLVTGQSDREEIRALKNFYTLVPDYIRELADQFIEFYKYHPCKILKLYHDRATNNLRKAGADVASQLQHDIEVDREGKRTGWVVELMSVGQGNIAHEDEYNLMQIMMRGKDKRFPMVKIDAANCPELKSSLELAPILREKGEIKKDKTSEQLDNIKRLPMESTNMSDAFKYFVCRRQWIQGMKELGGSAAVSDPMVW